MGSMPPVGFLALKVKDVIKNSLTPIIKNIVVLKENMASKDQGSSLLISLVHCYLYLQKLSYREDTMFFYNV